MESPEKSSAIVQEIAINSVATATRNKDFFIFSFLFY